MPHRIIEVESGSIADQCGIVPGETLVSINGETVRDQIDYQFLTAQEEMTLAIEDARGMREIVLSKDSEEPLGLIFADTLQARPRTCANHCVFCFIDQMPGGMRQSLYVKDDDWRLSLMMGNYITLTNVSEKEFGRILARRASPLYLSIHATDGDVRAQMMGNPDAADVMGRLHRLKDAGISFHCQIVLCPGYNDGAVLDGTLSALSALYPHARSAALVPVGLTRCREGLTALTPYDMTSALSLLEQAHAWQKRLLEKLDTRFVFPADEFYCMAGADLPPDDAYEGYPQIENGVGLLRTFLVEFEAAYRFHDEDPVRPRRVLIATGTSAAPFFRSLLKSHPLPGVTADVLAVENRFFGKSVTVAGLISGEDLRDAVTAAISKMPYDEILFSSTLLRREGDLFLDGLSLKALKASLPVPALAVDCDGGAFYDALRGADDLEA